MRIGLIGDGAISRYVQSHFAGSAVQVSALLLRPARLAAPEAAAGGPVRVASLADLPDGLGLMVDCAGHAALAEHGPALLSRGLDLMTVSVGALADPALYDALVSAAEAGGARLHLASGAIGALDCLQAARIGGLDAVTYTGRKPPAGWKGSPAETRLDLDRVDAPAVHFEGSARQAAIAYPKNANVAAAVALAGIGLDATTVRLIADPTIAANIHEVRAEGAFGSFAFRIDGRALPGNPRSSALAAMSVCAAIERLRAPLVL